LLQSKTGDIYGTSSDEENDDINVLRMIN
jgi:hypothetical protein